MKVVVTCDSFKDCLSSREVGISIIDGIKAVYSDVIIDHVPIADGGEGSLEAIGFTHDFESVVVEVNDPLFRLINAKYLFDNNLEIAYIEMASSSGLELLKEEQRNCSNTSSYGLGQLIAHVIDNGISNIILFIGGSATNDMGIGMAAALGVIFFDDRENPILKPIGRDLCRLKNVKPHNTLKDINLKLVCDVDNPLYGPQGASYTYGLQKGGSLEDLEKMDAGMIALNDLMAEISKTDYSTVAGSGAAGGVGAMCMYLFNTEIVSGSDFFFHNLGLEELIENADLVITGEGKMDDQTFHGKLISGLGIQCKKYRIPLIAVCGKVSVTDRLWKEIPLAEAYSLSDINKGCPYTSESTKKDLAKIGRQIAQKYLG